MDRGDWALWYDLASATTGPAEHRALQHAVILFPQSGLLPKRREGEEQAVSCSTLFRGAPRVSC